MNYGWRFLTLYRRQEASPSPKPKWLSEEALQIAEKRREEKGKGEKERYTHLNAEFQRIAQREKKAFLSDQCKEIEENNKMRKNRYFSKKMRDANEIFHEKMGTIKDRYGMDLTEAEDIKKIHRRTIYKNTQKNYTKNIFMAQIIMMVCSLTWSQISWNVKSSGP